MISRTVSLQDLGDQLPSGIADAGHGTTPHLPTLSRRFLTSWVHTYLLQVATAVSSTVLQLLQLASDRPLAVKQTMMVEKHFMSSYPRTV